MTLTSLIRIITVILYFMIALAENTIYLKCNESNIYRQICIGKEI